MSAALEDAKQRLLALSHRLRRYEARCEQYRQDRIFTSCPGKLYNSFKNTSTTDDAIPDKSDVFFSFGMEFGEHQGCIIFQHIGYAISIRDITICHSRQLYLFPLMMCLSK